MILPTVNGIHQTQQAPNPIRKTAERKEQTANEAGICPGQPVLDKPETLRRISFCPVDTSTSSSLGACRISDLSSSSPKRPLYSGSLSMSGQIAPLPRLSRPTSPSAHLSPVTELREYQQYIQRRSRVFLPENERTEKEMQKNSNADLPVVVAIGFVSGQAALSSGRWVGVTGQEVSSLFPSALRTTAPLLQSSRDSLTKDYDIAETEMKLEKQPVQVMSVEDEDRDEESIRRGSSSEDRSESGHV